MQINFLNRFKYQIMLLSNKHKTVHLFSISFIVLTKGLIL